MTSWFGSLFQRQQIGDNILDLLCGEDGLIAITSQDTMQARHHIVGRHDRLRVESFRFDDAQAELPGRVALANTVQSRTDGAMKLALWQRHGMTDGAIAPLTVEHHASATLWVAGLVGQWRWNGAVDDLVINQIGARLSFAASWVCY